MCLSTVGCSSTKTHESTYAAVLSDEDLDYLMPEILQMRGHMFLCMQDEYIECYSYTVEECDFALKPFNKSCVNETSEKLGDFGSDNGEQYLKEFIGCMNLSNYAANLVPSGYKIRQCLQNVDIEDVESKSKEYQIKTIRALMGLEHRK